MKEELERIIVSRYEIRHYPTSLAYSKTVGFKGRLLDHKTACKVVKRLKQSGVDVIKSKMSIYAWINKSGNIVHY